MGIYKLCIFSNLGKGYRLWKLIDPGKDNSKDFPI
jgi:hypothetical protein